MAHRKVLGLLIKTDWSIKDWAAVRKGSCGKSQVQQPSVRRSLVRHQSGMTVALRYLAHSTHLFAPHGGPHLRHCQTASRQAETAVRPPRTGCTRRSALREFLNGPPSGHASVGWDVGRIRNVSSSSYLRPSRARRPTFDGSATRSVQRGALTRAIGPG